MTDIADRFRRLSAEFSRKVAAVPEDRWSSPTPCEDWTARELVRHMVDNCHLMEKMVDRTLDPVPSVDDDPLGAWQAASKQVQAHLDDPATAETAYDGFFGPTTFERTVDRFVGMDLVVHGWDLARATGQDEAIDPDDVRRVQADADDLAPNMRRPGAIGDEVDAPEGADEQTRMLAFLGRRT